jgi:hypothetical protein
VAKPLFASKKLALYCLGSVLIMAHRRNLKSRGFEPPQGAVAKASWGGILGKIQRAFYGNTLSQKCTVEKPH